MILRLTGTRQHYVLSHHAWLSSHSTGERGMGALGAVIAFFVSVFIGALVPGGCSDSLF